MSIRSYIRTDYPLFTLYFTLYTLRIPSLTEEIRAAGDFKLHLCIKRQQDETPTTFSPCIQSSDNIIYEQALWVYKYCIPLTNSKRVLWKYFYYI